MFSFLGFLNTALIPLRAVGEDQAGVHSVGHDLVKPLTKALDRLQAAFRFDRTKQLDHHRRGDFRERGRLQVGKHVQHERPPNVLGVNRSNRVFLELEPGGGHVLDGVFGFRAPGFIQRVALPLRINALCKQLSRIDCHFRAFASDSSG